MADQELRKVRLFIDIMTSMDDNELDEYVQNLSDDASGGLLNSDLHLTEDERIIGIYGLSLSHAWEQLNRMFFQSAEQSSGEGS